MKRKIIILLALAFAGSFFARQSEIIVENKAQLLKAIQNIETSGIILLKNGIYEFSPHLFTEQICGNCNTPKEKTKGSYGLLIKNKSLELIGENREKVIIKSNAGYGILAEDCPRIVIRDITITGGTRDSDGNATNAAVVVRNSNLEIFRCIIRDNQGDFSETIAGIGGIMGREGAILHIHHNIIRDNSWDGIALYRGATATIHDNLIYNGRGAGIGITWDATAEIHRNVIHHYWKGIGSFGKSYAEVKNNLVRDLEGWGIVASGESEMLCTNNIVFNIGNVGIAGWDEDAKIIIEDNIILNCGTREQWVAPLVGIWINSKEKNYTIRRNFLSNNKEADFAFGYKPAKTENEKFTFVESRNLFENQMNYTQTILSVEDLEAKILSKNFNPFKDKGDPEILDADGSRSDLGIYGGWFGKWNWNPNKKPF